MQKLAESLNQDQGHGDHSHGGHGGHGDHGDHGHDHGNNEEV